MIGNNIYCRNLNCVKQRICQDNRGLYFEVRNRLQFSVFFILQYTINAGIVTKTSNVIEPGGTDKIDFPSRARNICVNVLEALTPQQQFICNVCLPLSIKTCIEVIRNSSGKFMCKSVVC